MEIPRIGHFKTVETFRQRLAELGLELPVDDKPLSAAEGSPLAAPLKMGRLTAPNRWVIQPMEGWDATPDGAPSEPMLRRWRNFGRSGAGMIWGGEAFAVRQDGRANPNQLYLQKDSEEHLGKLLAGLRESHREIYGEKSSKSVILGLQLTHSGRFCRPNRKDRLEPRIAYHHPLLDQRFGIDPRDDSVIFSDSDLRNLIENYIKAAKIAQNAGFDFVDVKHCHGYLGHELLSAYDRPGDFGGDLRNRSRFLREICHGIASNCPNLTIGVRLSLFDGPPFQPDPAGAGHGKLGRGVPVDVEGRYAGFGCDRENPLVMDLREPLELLRMMRDEMGVAGVNLTAGSPYYNPHMQRPAYFPPSDGYQPPEDPLVGCVRQIQAVRRIKEAIGEGLMIVGTAYTYFQQFVPQVAQGVVRAGWVDGVGLGRMVLSYPELPGDLLLGKGMAEKRICRTFSDCTTGPRNGLSSGCFPLDDFYRQSPEHEELKRVKVAIRVKLGGRPG